MEIFTAPPPEFLAAADLLVARAPASAWRREARPEQLPPDGDWFIWLVMAGRGWGKTWLGARWLAEQAQVNPGDYAVVGRSEQGCREVCIEGSSGLLKALGLRIGSRDYARGAGEIRLANGSTIYAYSAESPERGRGPNLSGVWCDELASWRFLSFMWDEILMPSVRIGNPKVVVTTTPRPIPLLREFVSRDDGSVVVTRGSTFANEENLSTQALAELRRRYAGTRIGRQELEGELIDDVEGALWTRELIEAYRIAKIDRGELARVVVAVDPAVSSGERSDETGIIVAGLDGAGQGYVLDDLTCRSSPDGWARRVAFAVSKWRADKVVAEKNNGGDLVESLLRTVDPSLPIKLVSASAGKVTRAEPVAAYYEQHRIAHVGAFPELEDQMCTFVAGQSGSPDRLDALVWAFTELTPGGGASAHVPIFAEHPPPSRWGMLRGGLIFGQ